jgi:DNA-directed RNA polymerase specialized sigma24 family protein
MTTHWTVLQELSAGRAKLPPEAEKEALAQLCEDYWPPLYRFVRHRGYNRDDSMDLTQGFFAYLIEKEVYRQSDRTKGRFRNFLLVCFKRYLNAVQVYQSGLKRGGRSRFVFLDDDRMNPAHKLVFRVLVSDGPADEERAFECDWAASLVSRAMAALEAEYATAQKARLLAVLRPFLTGGVGLPTHDAAAAALGVPLETMRSYLFRLRARYRALLRSEVARTVPTDQDIEEELQHLCRVLIAAA